MNSKKAEALLKKYWKGEADQHEELELKQFFSSTEGSSDQNAGYFRYLNEKNVKNPLGEKFDAEILELISKDANAGKSIKSFSMRYWYVAASVALVLSVSIVFQDRIFKAETPPPIVQADTFEDPEQAFEETKKALLFLSTRLNRSSEYASQFSKFEKSQEVVKQN